MQDRGGDAAATHTCVGLAPWARLHTVAQGSPCKGGTIPRNTHHRWRSSAEQSDKKHQKIFFLCWSRRRWGGFEGGEEEVRPCCSSSPPSLIQPSTKGWTLDKKKEEKKVDSVKSPAELKTALDILYDILIDALDHIAECKAYLQHRDETRYNTAAFIIRPDRPPERITVEVMRKIDAMREGESGDGVQSTDSTE